MADSDHERPTAGRVAVGFLAAAFASVTAFVVGMSIMSGGESPIGFAIFVYLFGIPIAALIILVLALPAYLLMRRHWEITWWNAALSGFMIAAVPAVLLGLTDLSLLTVIQFGLLGAVGGLVFWAIVRPRRSGLRINPETFR